MGVNITSHSIRLGRRIAYVCVMGTWRVLLEDAHTHELWGSCQLRKLFRIFKERRYEMLVGVRWYCVTDQ